MLTRFQGSSSARVPCLSWLLFTLLALALFSRAATADTRLVTSTEDSGPGTLRQTIADSDAGDTVAFALPLPAVITLQGGQIVIPRSLTVQGPGADLLMVSGNGTSRILEVTDGTVALSGLTLSGGGHDVIGGGLLANIGTNVCLAHCVIRNNSGCCGGGVANLGNMTLQDSTITGNQAINEGGGIFNGREADMTMLQCLVSGNVCLGHGGGIMGGESGHPGRLGLTDCVVAYNRALVGGGMFQDGDSVIIKHCMFASNSATLVSGGVEHFYIGTDINWNPIVSTMQDTVITGNDAPRNPDVMGQVGFLSLGGNTISIGNEGFQDGYREGDQAGTAKEPLLASARLFGCVSQIWSRFHVRILPLSDVVIPDRQQQEDSRSEVLKRLLHWKSRSILLDECEAAKDKRRSTLVSQPAA